MGLGNKIITVLPCCVTLLEVPQIVAQLPMVVMAVTYPRFPYKTRIS
jgi:hypothetical protein